TAGAEIDGAAEPFCMQSGRQIGYFDNAIVDGQVPEALQRRGPVRGDLIPVGIPLSSARACPMSMIAWILLGLELSITREGTVVDILVGMIGAVIDGWLFNLFSGGGVTGFKIDGVYSAGIAAIGAIILLALYHAFFRRHVL